MTRSRCDQREALVVEVEDRPAAIGELTRLLADANVNVDLADATLGGVKTVIATDDLASARAGGPSDSGAGPDAPPTGSPRAGRRLRHDLRPQPRVRREHRQILLRSRVLTLNEQEPPAVTLNASACS